ncbi:MAG: hypothetical protein J5635_04350 [Paludibacteraceae bacterium]|nr:hypothetical protein [Paludibacteraceae bacterium]
MACFIVPLTQAIATTAYRKLSGQSDTFVGRNLRTLELMLWGGSVMLIVDHILNGELVWYWPFFTALETEGGGAVMLREILTVGVPISVAVTAVWAVWCALKERRTVRN